MFGLFKKRARPSSHPSQDAEASALAKLCELHEELSKDVAALYSEFDSYNPAELRFFTMSAVSVFVQSFGNLSQTDMQSLVEKFTEQCVAMMLLICQKPNIRPSITSSSDAFRPILT